MFEGFPLGQMLMGLLGGGQTNALPPADPTAFMGPQVGQTMPNLGGMPSIPPAMGIPGTMGGGSFGGPLERGMIGLPSMGGDMLPPAEPGPAMDITPPGTFGGGGMTPTPTTPTAPGARTNALPKANDPMAALRGVQAPPMPQPQKVSSPSAPRPQPIQGAGLQQLMSLIFGGGAKPPGAMPGLGSLLGGR